MPSGGKGLPGPLKGYRAPEVSRELETHWVLEACHSQMEAHCEPHLDCGPEFGDSSFRRRGLSCKVSVKSLQKRTSVTKPPDLQMQLFILDHQIVSGSDVALLVTSPGFPPHCGPEIFHLCRLFEISSRRGWTSFIVPLYSRCWPLELASGSGEVRHL